MWSLPTEWSVPLEETFYGKKLDIYEHTALEYKYVTPHLKQYRTAIDIGAHIGSTTVRYAKDFNQVHSFEPVYTKELEHNTKHLENVTRYDVALDASKTNKMMVRRSKNSGRTFITDNLPKIYMTNHTVHTNMLDFYGFTNVDFIKIDTEDYVMPILKGGYETLKHNNPILQIEVGADKLKPRVDEFLNDLGYKLYDTFSVERFYKR